MQQRFGLSDETTEDAICDSHAILHFADSDLNREAAPNATTLLKFRHLLEVEVHQLPKSILNAINVYLVEKGWFLVRTPVWMPH